MRTECRSDTEMGSVEAHQNPFLDRAIAAGYECWYTTGGRRADRLETALLARLLALFPDARTVLEIGCGTGHFTRLLASHGLRALGLDSSPAMLAEARRRGSALLVLGDARALPFRSGCCDLAAMITTLEFLDEPLLALREALRVARMGLILGVLNRTSRLGRRLERKGGPVWSAAHLYTPAELEAGVHVALDGRDAQLVWRTTLWPLWPRDLPQSHGGFIGMAVCLLRGDAAPHRYPRWKETLECDRVTRCRCC